MNNGSASKPVRIFVSYSHENATWFKRLLPVLQFARHAEIVGAWHDQMLKAGDRWDKTIREELEVMDVFVCLVSYEFLASGYIKDVELCRALARHRNGEIEILPLLLYDVNLRRDCEELYPFNTLPEWGKCWHDYELSGGHYQQAHKTIRNGLWDAIDRVKARRAETQPQV